MNTISICNQALAYLGEEPIDNLDEDIQTARLCKQFWPLVRDVVLSRHDWQCAARKTTLTTPQITPQGERMFALPADTLRLIDANGAEMRAGALYTQEAVSTLRIVYVRTLTDFRGCPASLVEALSLRLAASLSRPLTRDLRQAEQMRLDGERALLEAISQDHLHVQGRLQKVLVAQEQHNTPPKYLLD